MGAWRRRRGASARHLCAPPAPFYAPVGEYGAKSRRWPSEAELLRVTPSSNYRSRRLIIVGVGTTIASFWSQTTLAPVLFSRSAKQPTTAARSRPFLSYRLQQATREETLAGPLRLGGMGAPPLIVQKLGWTWERSFARSGGYRSALKLLGRMALYYTLQTPKSRVFLKTKPAICSTAL